MEIVLNEYTETAHKPQAEAVDLQTVCGVTRTRSPDHFRTLPLEQALADHDVSKCGRCFEDGGGY